MPGFLLCSVAASDVRMRQTCFMYIIIDFILLNQLGQVERYVQMYIKVYFVYIHKNSMTMTYYYILYQVHRLNLVHVCSHRLSDSIIITMDVGILLCAFENSQRPGVYIYTYH